VTEEWQLLSARLLAAGGARGHAAGLAENLLTASTVQHQTKLGACDVLEAIGRVRPALRESARILRIFLSPSRAELRHMSYTYARVRESMARLLGRMGEREGARAHAALASQPPPLAWASIARRQHRGHLACDSCSAFYTPHGGVVTVICEACGGHGAVHGDGCIFCGSERRFVCDRASAGRPCPICGVGSVRWS